MACDALAGPVHPISGRIMALPVKIIEVSGVIVAPPCQINNDNPVDVAFNDLVIEQIDGVRFAQAVPVNITCPGSFGGDLDLKVSASIASFNSDAIATNNENLGIKLMLDGNVIKLNTLQEINWREPIALQAIPIKHVSNSLNAGAFTATATLMVTVH